MSSFPSFWCHFDDDNYVRFNSAFSRLLLCRPPFPFSSPILPSFPPPPCSSRLPALCPSPPRTNLSSSSLFTSHARHRGVFILLRLQVFIPNLLKMLATQHAAAKAGAPLWIGRRALATGPQLAAACSALRELYACVT